MHFAKKASLTIVALAGCSGLALAIDGTIPPDPGTPSYIANQDFFETIEAACGWGRTLNLDGTNFENNNFCSGVLVAPNIVLTSSHCVSGDFAADSGEVGPSDSRLWNNFGTPSQAPKYTVRFRLNPNGSVGTLAGGHSTFFQAPVKRMIFPQPPSPNPNGLTKEFDMVLLILADGPSDTDNGGIWSDGWITHIDPVPILPTLTESAAPFTGYSATYGPIPNGSSFGINRGILRYREFTSLRFSNQPTNSPLPRNLVYSDTNPAWSVDQSGTTGAFWVGDSGGVTFLETEAGEYIAAWGVPGGWGLSNKAALPLSETWSSYFGIEQSNGLPPLVPIYGTPELYTPSPFDVTRSPSETGSGYKPDWSISIPDVLAMASGNPSLDSADWDGNSVINSLDFKAYASDLYTADNPYFSGSLLPLFAGMSDVNGDGRFNQGDYEALTSLLGATAPSELIHDYDESGIIDAADLAILNTVLTILEPGTNPFVTYPPMFDQGFAGDVDGDDDVDCSDYTAITSQLGLFDGRVAGDTGYAVRLDMDMNHVLDETDERIILSRLLPGDTTTSFSSYVYNRIDPDFVLDDYDARMYLLHASRGFGGGAPIGVDVVGPAWGTGAGYSLPDGVVDTNDVLWTLGSWVNSCSGSFSTSSLLDLWFLDLNSDGRANILDMRELEANLGSITMPEWDFDGSGDINDADINAFTEILIVSSPFGQGFLGDFDGSGSPKCYCDFLPSLISYYFCQDQIDPDINCGEPQVSTVADCDDLVAMRDTHSGGLDDLFGSGYSYGDAEFVIQLDADLDGDMDADDREAVLLHLQRADFTLDGFVDSLDYTAFIDAYTNNEPIADMNNDASFDFLDISAFTAAYAAACP